MERVSVRRRAFFGDDTPLTPPSDTFGDARRGVVAMVATAV
jgi:hypothetical protein